MGEVTRQVKLKPAFWTAKLNGDNIGDGTHFGNCDLQGRGLVASETLSQNISCMSANQKEVKETEANRWKKIFPPGKSSVTHK